MSRPPEAEVRIYYRVFNSGTNEDVDSRGWTLMQLPLQYDSSPSEEVLWKKFYYEVSGLNFQRIPNQNCNEIYKPSKSSSNCRSSCYRPCNIIMSEESKLIPVEGKEGWFRDPSSNAIVNLTNPIMINIWRHTINAKRKN
ncbi:MAG: hypothetical protein CM15mV41_1080 [Caudoviricetes sp.]|nr:MAG: hypothetical protein CM15mV41_1080 [Caudoviricetes sp.]